jgi:hypothetical protein
VSSGQRTLAALGLAAALGGVYWGWVIKLKPKREAAKEEAKKLFAGADAANTAEILLRKKGSDDVLLRKVDGAWRLIKPIQAPADASSVAGLVSSLAQAKREEIVVEKDADLRTYGLDQPSGAVTFTPASPGAKAKVLFFGNDNPTGSYAYGMIDGLPEVFLTYLSVKNAALKDADSLRDKTVWSFNSADVESLRSTQGGGFTLKRGDSAGWVILSGGKSEPGRGAEVEEWLGELQALRATHVPSEDGKGDWGMRKGPRLYVTLKGGARLELGAGKAKDKDGFYAQGAPGTPVFVLPPMALTTLQKGVNDLADRRAFNVTAADVERFEVKRGGRSLVAVKTAGAWAWDPAVKPGGQEFKFDDFVGRFAGAQLLERLDEKRKPAKADASVLFYGHGGVLMETAEFGPRRGKGVVAVSGTKHWVSVVADNLLDGLPAPETATAKP